jgi:hypothetical protein
LLFLLLQDVIPQVGGISIQLQRFPHGMRTVGYDVPAVDWMQYEAPAAAAAAAADVDQPAQSFMETISAGSKTGAGGCSCGHHGAHKHTEQQQPSASAAAAAHAEAAARLGLSAERLQSLQQQLQEIAQHRRVTGYDVPALDQQQESLKQFEARQQQSGSPAAAAAAAAAAATVGVIKPDSVSSVQQDDLLQARRYFKNPCNNADARQQFKNTNNHPLHRVYYKNPANAPVQLQDTPMHPQQVRVTVTCKQQVRGVFAPLAVRQWSEQPMQWAVSTVVCVL